MRWFSLLVFVLTFSAEMQAHHPNKECQPVHPRYDLIGPLGTRLPMSYRRAYNRPRKIGGKIAYYIAPSSQEAMAWHNATHRGYYEHHRPRMEMHYFYPKPWESLKVGPRVSESKKSDYEADAGEENGLEDVVVDQMELSVQEPLTNDAGLIEE